MPVTIIPQLKPAAATSASAQVVSDQSATSISQAPPSVAYQPPAQAYTPPVYQAPYQPPVMVQPYPAPTYYPPPNYYANYQGSPDTAGTDISKLLPANGQGNLVTVLLALIAVMGGGAAWRFYAQRSKQKHDQALKELEVREKAATASQEEQKLRYEAGLSTCADATKALNARVDDLIGKVGDLTNSVEIVGKRMAETEELVSKIVRTASRIDDIESRTDDLERRVKRLTKQDETA